MKLKHDDEAEVRQAPESLSIRSYGELREQLRRELPDQHPEWIDSEVKLREKRRLKGVVESGRR